MGKRIKNIAYLVVCLFGFLSCEYEVIEPVEIITPDLMSFTTDIIPIFDKSCNTSGCHVQGHFKVDLTPTNAYADLFAKDLVDTLVPTDSKLYTKLIEPSSSHLSKTEAGQPESILKWIEQGAKNN